MNKNLLIALIFIFIFLAFYFAFKFEYITFPFVFALSGKSNALTPVVSPKQFGGLAEQIAEINNALGLSLAGQ